VLNTSTNNINITGNSGSGSGVLTTTFNGGQASWISATNPTNNGSLTVARKATFKKDVEIDGDLIINGIELGDRLGKIEERLGILRPNERLESKWQELQELGKQYRELEADLLEREELLRILKQ
jgi:hypothetical protein